MQYCSKCVSVWPQSRSLHRACFTRSQTRKHLPGYLLLSLLVCLQQIWWSDGGCNQCCPARVISRQDGEGSPGHPDLTTSHHQPQPSNLTICKFLLPDPASTFIGSGRFKQVVIVHNYKDVPEYSGKSERFCPAVFQQVAKYNGKRSFMNHQMQTKNPNPSKECRVFRYIYFILLRD